MELALEKFLHPSAQYPQAPSPAKPDAGSPYSKLTISVVYTSVDSTLTALRAAGSLASRLNAEIALLVPQIVPHPLPLESPPVLIDWNERRLKVIAEQSSVDTKVCLYLCRDRLATLISVLKPHSIVVIGGL